LATLRVHTITSISTLIRPEPRDFVQSVSQIGKSNLYSPAYSSKLLPLFSEKQTEIPKSPLEDGPSGPIQNSRFGAVRGTKIAFCANMVPRESNTKYGHEGDAYLAAFNAGVSRE
jgi:hypothetical protein